MALRENLTREGRRDAAAIVRKFFVQVMVGRGDLDDDLGFGLFVRCSKSVGKQVIEDVIQFDLSNTNSLLL